MLVPHDVERWGAALAPEYTPPLPLVRLAELVRLVGAAQGLPVNAAAQAVLERLIRARTVKTWLLRPGQFAMSLNLTWLTPDRRRLPGELAPVGVAADQFEQVPWLWRPWSPSGRDRLKWGTPDSGWIRLPVWQAFLYEEIGRYRTPEEIDPQGTGYVLVEARQLEAVAEQKALEKGDEVFEWLMFLWGMVAKTFDQIDGFRNVTPRLGVTDWRDEARVAISEADAVALLGKLLPPQGVELPSAAHVASKSEKATALRDERAGADVERERIRRAIGLLDEEFAAIVAKGKPRRSAVGARRSAVHKVVVAVLRLARDGNISEGKAGARIGESLGLDPRVVRSYMQSSKGDRANIERELASERSTRNIVHSLT